MISSNPGSLPLDQVFYLLIATNFFQILPAIFQHLPLKFDMEENKAIYPAISALVLSKHPAVCIRFYFSESDVDRPLHSPHCLIVLGFALKFESTRSGEGANGHNSKIFMLRIPIRDGAVEFSVIQPAKGKFTKVLCFLNKKKAAPAFSDPIY
jgi:hypothetical protein